MTTLTDNPRTPVPSPMNGAVAHRIAPPTQPDKPIHEQYSVSVDPLAMLNGNAVAAASDLRHALNLLDGLPGVNVVVGGTDRSPERKAYPDRATQAREYMKRNGPATGEAIGAAVSPPYQNPHVAMARMNGVLRRDDGLYFLADTLSPIA